MNETLQLFEAMEAELHQEVYRTLQCIDTSDTGDSDYLDVRLQLSANGSFDVHTGDPSYDTDHRGFWGASTLSRDADDLELQDVALELVEEAIEDAAL